jgi:NADH-quinone oxidoreductase subunit I
MRGPVRKIEQALKTILIGMRITLQYCFARTVTLQYPTMAPALQPRYRGFHWYEIEKCSACGLCARACPVDCIYVKAAGPRKIDRAAGVSRGGAMVRYAIDYSKCMFCGLCLEPCPTQCLHMGNIHDLSGYSREGTLVEFTELAGQGQRTPMPLWMQKRDPPPWARERKAAWDELAKARQDEMRLALTDQTPAKKPPAEGSESGPAAAKVS